MAFTGDIKNAQSVDLPFLSVTVGERKGIVAFSCHKEDMTQNKVGSWNFDISDFKLDTCITETSQISKVTIVNGSDDGWNIASVVTIVRAGKKYYVLTSDMNANKWIDGDDKRSRLQFDLTLVN